MTSIRSGSTRLPVAPLAALFAFAVLAMTWVASSHVCARPMMMSMDGMAGMDMSTMDMSGGGVMICPVVLGLIVLSTVLAAWALLVVWRDRQRSVTAVQFGRLIARLPVLRTFAALATAGGFAIAAIAAVDGHQGIDLSLSLLLAGILAGMSLAATVCALLVARIALALGARLLLALSQALVERARASTRRRLARPRALRRLPVLLASGRGLRAPPVHVH